MLMCRSYQSHLKPFSDLHLIASDNLPRPSNGCQETRQEETGVIVSHGRPDMVSICECERDSKGYCFGDGCQDGNIHMTSRFKVHLVHVNLLLFVLLVE